MAASQPEIIVVSNSEALSRTAADMIIGKIKEVLAHQEKFSLALAGGSTPKGLYSLLAESPEYCDHIPWQRIHFFWGDERHVPPDHAESNFHMASEAMLSKLPVPAENIHRVQAELPDAAKAASDYEQELKRFVRLDTQKLPRLDCVLLGMGPDGHTASLFPGTKALQEKRRLVVSNWVGKFNAHRITMTLPVLNNAAMVIFMISGKNKAEVLKDILEGEYRPELLPAQLIRPVHGRLAWLVDKAAAARLAHPPV